MGQAVDTLIADLSSQASVRKLAAEALGRYPRIDILVNNAGAMYTHPAAEPRRHRVDLGGQSPGAILAHRPAARSAARECAGTHHHHRVGCPWWRDDSLRRSRRGALLSKLRPLRRDQACQHPLHQRAGAAPRGQWRDGQLLPSRVVATGFNRNNGLLMRLGMALLRPFSRSSEQGRGDPGMARRIARGCRRQRRLFRRSATNDAEPRRTG